MKNGWRSRVAALCLGTGIAVLHAKVMADVPNTDVGMFLYHWSAAFAEFLLIAAAPRFLEGKLCDAIEYTCIASILLNCLGWLGYLAYAPPVFYDTAILGLSCGQILLLLMGGRHADYSHFVGNVLLRGSSAGRPKLHFEKAKR